MVYTRRIFGFVCIVALLARDPSKAPFGIWQFQNWQIWGPAFVGVLICTRLINRKKQ